MNRKMWLRLSALPFVLALGSAPVSTGCDVIAAASCPDFNASAGFGANLNIDADVKTFMQAAGNFQILSKQMITDVGDACVKLATAAGGDSAKWSGKEGSDRVTAACGEADLKLKAAIQGASIDVLIEGGECKVSLTATASCNASCDVSGKCTPAELQAHCEPGKLSGSCSAECKGSCSADAGSINCAGACDATCTGTCAGTCNGRCDGQASSGKCAGTCEGRCDTECTGSCSGKCTYTDPSVKCTGTCHGDCSVEYKEPFCEGKFTPPTCQIDANCQANCEASATAQAECTEPKVSYTLTSPTGADLTAIAKALEETLPVFIVNSVERGEGLVTSVQALADSGQSIANKSGLAADAAACAVAAAAAAVTAAADIKVSVQFSVQVTASASGSASAG
jgi:hypothetical protein